MPKPLVILTSAVPLTRSNPALGAVSESFLMFEETALTVTSGRYCRRNKFNILEVWGYTGNCVLEECLPAVIPL